MFFSDIYIFFIQFLYTTPYSFKSRTLFCIRTTQANMNISPKKHQNSWWIKIIRDRKIWFKNTRTRKTICRCTGHVFLPQATPASANMSPDLPDDNVNLNSRILSEDRFCTSLVNPVQLFLFEFLFVEIFNLFGSFSMRKRSFFRLCCSLD